jgi:hypothetical protein
LRKVEKGPFLTRGAANNWLKKLFEKINYGWNKGKA